MMDYDDFYGGLSEFDEQCEEFKNTLREEVKEEIKNKLAALEKENAELREIAKDVTKALKEAKDAKERYVWEESQEKERIGEMKIGELVSEFAPNLWQVDYDMVMGAKCDKCDEEGYIHFTSPQGKKYKELCNCRIRTPVYKPVITKLQRIFSNGRETKVFYARVTEDCCWIELSQPYETVFKGDDYSTLHKNSIYNTFFETEEEAQKFADYLNEQEGKKERNDYKGINVRYDT